MKHNPAPALLRLILSALLLIILAIYGWQLLSQSLPLDLLARHQAPSWQHWFGTDNMGRDLWVRCFQGVTTSLQVGVGAAICSGGIALLLASLTLLHPTMDRLVRMLIDTLLALPHLLLLILLCFTLGGGKQGVIVAVALTHWPKLALLLRAEMHRVRSCDYLMLAKRIGNGALYRWRHHFLPAVLPQYLIGTLLMFPHAVLHSAALSFLGFGLQPHEPSLGILLADALRYLSTGSWWLALFPGLVLLATVLLFDQLARSLQQLWLRFE
ncbi:ABC transporter permease [Dongshaea marina]|uniref:ABC transporter permease n=1 Tax=Dongshaea marina TaxID=2047966 RepID=UPI000D3E626D|nr:ABC transporter permease [Dongshaea marina]